MIGDTTTVERAFQLARSGDCMSVDDIRKRLMKEGHTSVDSHLTGPSLRKQLQGEIVKRIS